MAKRASSGIQKVELRVDDGLTWNVARLDAPLSQEFLGQTFGDKSAGERPGERSGLSSFAALRMTGVLSKCLFLGAMNCKFVLNEIQCSHGAYIQTLESLRQRVEEVFLS